MRMKKLCSTILVIMVCVLMVHTVSASGLARAIMEDKQSYLLLATVEDITDAHIVLNPFYTFVRSDARQTGQAPQTGVPISVEKFRYSYCIEHGDWFNAPKLGDNVFISLSRKGGYYVMKNGAYKTDSVDYKTMRFRIPVDMKGQECMTDPVALAYFVRTDGQVSEFEFGEGTVSVVQGERRLELYPSDSTENELISFVGNDGKVLSAGKSKDVIADTDATLPQKDYRWIYALTLLVIGIVAGAVAVYLTGKQELHKTIGNRK
ncbi:MAG: hypothetical protein E7409_07125 [Ruminococcaceae bacterium]|nr:hypothetical protein [Oscillospiraceae bacterium]